MTTIAEIQKHLISRKLDACIITRGNMFLEQDILPEENLLCSLTGFTGSAGKLIIFRNRACLLVDGRYDIQARRQTDPASVEVFCTRDSLGTWIQHNVTQPCKFAYDPWCHSIAEVDFWKRVLTSHEFVETPPEFPAVRPSERDAEIFELDERFTGISADEKISYLTKFCADNNLDAYFIGECDCVSWLLNLRSRLLADTPVLRAFALVSAAGGVSLFVKDFDKLAAEFDTWRGKTIGLAFNRCPKKIQTLLRDKHVRCVNISDPVVDWKAVKNPVEIAGFRAAHRRDAAAVCRFLHWLEANWQTADELGVVAKLHEFRAAGENYYSESFATIAGFAANGAVVHYQPTERTNRRLESGSVLLLDSGAQYLDGTTDITRTVAIGTPPQEIIDDFTRVLKAHIAAADALLPPDTPGLVPDTLARAALWRFGKDYAHGTGHGVGHFLNVHEGPQSLSLKSLAPLKAGMITSIEPGYYKENTYGIRIENLYLLEETSVENKPLLRFEPLTMVPFDRRLINKALLSPAEIDWVNAYHQKVLTALSGFLPAEENAWLQAAAAPL